MANTYSLIASTKLTSDQASVSLSAIPNTYDDLVLHFSIATANPSSSDGLYITLNSATSGYSQTHIAGTGASVVSARYTGNAYFRAPGVNGSTSSAFTSGEFYIPKYTASQFKPLSQITFQEANSTTGYIYAHADLFSINSAISSVTFVSANAANILSGSSFFLYGIKNT